MSPDALTEDPAIRGCSQSRQVETGAAQEAAALRGLAQWHLEWLESRILWVAHKMKCASCFLDWMDQMETTDRVQTNSPIVHKGAPCSPLKCFCSVWKETTYPHETDFWEENWQLKEKLRRPHSSWNHLEADTVIFD